MIFINSDIENNTALSAGRVRDCSGKPTARTGLRAEAGARICSVKPGPLTNGNAIVLISELGFSISDLRFWGCFFRHVELVSTSHLLNRVQGKAFYLSCGGPKQVRDDDLEGHVDYLSKPDADQGVSPSRV
ncbi:hypothetical protein ACEN9X_15755 [Mucilaginibacter sp. Mucisp86]|uniref:hypothetical protein n=1 Tax=Mucilaginibacter sp. Mucisp86 TaxID=3243060 RepID=UPI0039B4E163